MPKPEVVAIAPLRRDRWASDLVAAAGIDPQQVRSTQADAAAAVAEVRRVVFAIGSFFPTATHAHEGAHAMSKTDRLIGNRHPRAALSAVTTRLAVRAAVNSGKFTGDQLAALNEALQDDDVLSVLSEQASQAGLADPTDPTTPAPKRDWAGFFAAFGDFLVKVMPVILHLIQQLGGMTGTTAVAKASEHASSSSSSSSSSMVLRSSELDLIRQIRSMHPDHQARFAKIGDGSIAKGIGNLIQVLSANGPALASILKVLLPLATGA